MTKRRAILVIHNRYIEAGGEDTSSISNVDILRDAGYDVHYLAFDNEDLKTMTPVRKAEVTLWNRSAYKTVYEKCVQNDVFAVHIHNFFPLASPSIHHAAYDSGAKVFQWLHNYRLICPTATFLRDGSVCEDCLGKNFAWPSIVHSCYRKSKIETTGVASMLLLHRLMGTWNNKVHRYIALTDFAKAKFVEAGFNPDRITVIPNHLKPTPERGAGTGGFSVFVGRLSVEKGIDTLVDLAKMPSPGVCLKVFGDGPLRADIENAARGSDFVRYCGHAPTPEILKQLGDAQCLVLPSRWYEGLPRTIIEAFAVGTPVVACPIGAMQSLIKPSINGEHFPIGDSRALWTILRQIASDDAYRSVLRAGARRSFETHFTAETAIQRIRAEMEPLLQDRELLH